MKTKAPAKSFQDPTGAFVILGKFEEEKNKLHLRRNDLQFWLMLVQPEHLGALHAAHEISFCNSHEEPQLSALRNCFLQHLCILSLHLWRSDDFHFPVKAEALAEEGFARGHQHAGLKCFTVHRKGLDVFSETIDDVIHQAVLQSELLPEDRMQIRYAPRWTDLRLSAHGDH